MMRSYAITVAYARSTDGRYADTQTLFISAASGGLVVLLQVLNDSPAVASISVCHTLTIPELTKMTKLTRSDLGLPETALSKMK